MAWDNPNNNRRSSLVSKSGGSRESIFSFGSLDKLDRFGSLNNLQKLEHEFEEDGINVVVRVRPLNAKEQKARDHSVIRFPGNGQILLQGLNLITADEEQQKSKLFSFNVVFEPNATQSDVFDYCGIKKLIGMAVEGFNTTCFCYGQTGSGKTHTLTGPPGMFLKKKMDPFAVDHGLVYRSFLHLFQKLREKTEVHFVLKASFLEIYNEKVIDLLNPSTTKKNLAVRWSKKSRSFFVENLFTVDCEELDDLQAVLEEGMKNRSVGSHNLNNYSGRSHTILTVHITSEQQMDESSVYITKQGKINFVDLAGSEMTKKTNSSGKTLEEANNINKSLMILGYCISSLSDPKKRKGHIPYRDSKLTKLLSDSLAGNGVTLMIACISPASSNVCESLNALRYAARAKRIRTKPIVVMDPRETLIVALKREVEALQNENCSLRTALDLNKTYVENMKKSSETYEKLTKIKPLNVDKLARMKTTELVDLIKHYAVENESLRKENSDLFNSRDVLLRDHELVCRENERLHKKMDKNSSSISIERKSHSAEGDFATDDIDLQSNFTGDNLIESNNTSSNDSNSSRTSSLPYSIRKELDKKRIGKSDNAKDLMRIRKGTDKKYNTDLRKPNEKLVSASVLRYILGSPLPEINRRRASAESTNVKMDSKLDSSRLKTSSYSAGLNRVDSWEEITPLNGCYRPMSLTGRFRSPLSKIITPLEGLVK